MKMTILNHPMDMALLLMIFLFAIWLFRLNRERKEFDLRYLIVNDKSKRPSLHKLGQLVALMISSWVFVYQTLHGTLTDFYAASYMGCWAAAGVANTYADRYSNRRFNGILDSNSAYPEDPESYPMGQTRDDMGGTSVIPRGDQSK